MVRLARISNENKQSVHAISLRYSNIFILNTTFIPVKLGLNLKTRIRFGKLAMVLKPVDRHEILGGVENT